MTRTLVGKIPRPNYWTVTEETKGKGQVQKKKKIDYGVSKLKVFKCISLSGMKFIHRRENWNIGYNSNERLNWCI